MSKYCKNNKRNEGCIDGMKVKYINPFTDFGFKKLFGEKGNAEITNFNKYQLAQYEESLKIYRDNMNTLKTARIGGREEGIKEGREEGIEEGIEAEKVRIVKTAIKKGISDDMIQELTGVDIAKINKLRRG